MNFQSRYPGGIVVTMICLASLLSVCVLVSAVAFPAVMPVLSCPNDEGVIHAITPGYCYDCDEQKCNSFHGSLLRLVYPQLAMFAAQYG